MKTVTQEWLNYAWRDLEAARKLVDEEHLTGVAAVHAQQVLEKSLKAIIEEYEVGFVKTHDIERLYAITGAKLSLDEDVLEQLNTVYTEARYPSDLGLMPGGLPSAEDARHFLIFAEQAYEKTKGLLEEA